jgi:hypothetical protein
LTECKKCGLDAAEVLAMLRKHVAGLDTLLWEMELANDR